jgi:hypothetical protein
MVILPLGFVATKYPGYFFHPESNELYSVKVTGELKPMKITTPNHWNHLRERGYRVSVKGVRRFLSMAYLKALPTGLVQQYPVAKDK